MRYVVSSGYGYSNGAEIWIIVSLILGVIGGILTYFLFLTKKNDGKFKGFVKWLYEFLSFKKMCIEVILKIIYLILTIYITLSSFAFISSPAAFFGLLILGNLSIRIMFEFSLLFLMMFNQVKEINDKMKK